MMRRSDRGLTAVEFIVVIVVVGIAAAVTVPAMLRIGRNDKLARCESNLRALGKIEPGALQERGAAYWAKAAEAANLKPELLVCPLSGARYRGPGVDPATLPPGSPIAADAPGSHGDDEGGNVLLKTGDVRAVRERDGLWQFAAEKLSP